MRPRFSNWQVPLVFTPSQTSVWMGLSFYQVHGTKTLCLWEITEHCMRPRFSNWQVSPVFMPSLTSVWMRQHFTKSTEQNPLPVGHFVKPAFL